MPEPTIRGAETLAVPLRKRVEAFEEEYARYMIPCQIQPRDDNFFASLDIGHFGPVMVSEMAGNGGVFESTPEAAKNNPGFIVYKVVLRGTGFLTCSGDTVAINRGDAALFSARESFQCGAAGTYECRSIHFPEEALGPELAEALHTFPGRIPPNSAEAILLRNYVAALPAAAGGTEPGFRDTIGGQVLDLMVATIAHNLGVPDPTRGQGASALRLTRARGIIEREFSDPGLSDFGVARQLGITDNELHALFEAAGLSFGACLVEQRLRFARQHLSSAQGVSLDDVASRAGFASLTKFRQAFRRRFGEPPAVNRSTVGLEQ